MSQTAELPLTMDPSAAPAIGAGPITSPTPSRPSLRPPPVATASTRPGNSLAALRAWLVSLLTTAFRQRAITESVWLWADAAGLPVEGGGKFISRKKPHCRRFIEKTADPEIREQHVMKASRAGFTQAALVRVAHKMVHDIGNVQLTVGSLQKSRDTNTQRLIPMLERVGVIGRPEDDPDDATSCRIRIAGSSIRVVGGFTKSAYTADMVDFCINDEAETVTDIKGIGTPADGARSRIRGREGGQLVSIARPDQWASPHHRDVATGTLEFLLVPCPHCGTFQELTISGQSLVDQLRIEDNPDRRNGPPISPPLTSRTAHLGRLRFDHCKLLPGIDGAANPTGWDFNRIVSETYYECAAGLDYDEAGNVTRHCRIEQDAPLTDADLANPLCSFTDEVRALHAEGFFLTHKQAMVLSGRHLASNPRPIPADGGGPRSKRSEHNSDLVCLDFDMTWGHFAKKFAERAHDSLALRNFLAEHCGLPQPVAAAEQTVTETHLAECRAAYERGTIPFVPDILALGGDSQDRFRKHVIVAARLDTAGKAWRDIAVIDYGYDALRSDMIALLEKKYPLAEIAALHSRTGYAPDRIFTVECGVVDAGGAKGNTPDVYELSYESGRRLLPSFGRGGDTAELRPTWFSEIKQGWRGIEIPICMYWDEHWKSKVLSCIKLIREIKAAADVKSAAPTDQLAALDPSALSLPPRLWIPGLPADNRRKEFEEEIIAEQLNAKGKWEHPNGPNDFQDCLKTCLVVLDVRLPFVRARKEAAAAESRAKSSVSAPPV